MGQLGAAVRGAGAVSGEGPCAGAAARAPSRSRGPVLQGWPSQRDAMGAEVTAAEIGREVAMLGRMRRSLLHGRRLSG